METIKKTIEKAASSVRETVAAVFTAAPVFSLTATFACGSLVFVPSATGRQSLAPKAAVMRFGIKKTRKAIIIPLWKTKIRPF